MERAKVYCYRRVLTASVRREALPTRVLVRQQASSSSTSTDQGSLESRHGGVHSQRRHDGAPPPPPAAVSSSSSSSLLRTSSCGCRRRFSSSSTGVAVATAGFPRRIREEEAATTDFQEMEPTRGFARRADDEPWKSLLELPARAKWRVSNPLLPHAIEEARRDVLRALPSHYSKIKSKELLRVLHDTVFAAHRAMARQRDKERRIAFYGDTDDKNKNKNDSNNNASSSNALLLPYGPVEAVAALRHRLHPNYEIVRRVLLETKSLIMTNPHRRPVRRVIDFGIGVGSSTLAAMDVFGTSDDNDSGAIEWVHGIDASKTMQEVAGELVQRYCYHRTQEQQQHQHDGPQSYAPPRFTFSSHLSSSSSSSTGGDGFDLALCCYTMAELPSCASGLAAAALLWDKLAPNGFLVVIEPGTPDGFANIRTIRNMLIDCCRPDIDDDDDKSNELVEECHILAPCTHMGKCPMELYPRKLSNGNNKTQEDVVASEEDELSDDDHDHDDDNVDEDDDANAFDEDDDADSAASAVAAAAGDGETRRGYCSFVQAMPGTKSRSKGEKFSYLVVQKRVRSAEKERRAGDDKVPAFFTNNLAELLQRTHQSTFVSFEEHSKTIREAIDLEVKYLDSDLDPLGLEFLQSDENRASFGRILHAPIKRKGHVWIDCCTGGGAGGSIANNPYADGRIVRHGISKSMSKVAPGMYAAARKSRWGGYWPNLRLSSLERQPSNDDDDP